MTASEKFCRLTIGLLVCGHAPEPLLHDTGDYDSLFKRLLGEDRFDYRTWKVVDGELPDGPDQCDGWLLTGSRHGAYENHPWIAPLEAFIRNTYAAGVPMVGICFGHQILAQALGGRVEKFAGGWSVGPVTYELELPQGTQPVALHAYHQDQVIEVPPDARVIGHSDFCANAALVYGDRVLSVQPHPEFDDAFVRGLLEARGASLPPDVLHGATELIGAGLQRDLVARWLGDFLETGSHGAGTASAEVTGMKTTGSGTTGAGATGA